MINNSKDMFQFLISKEAAINMIDINCLKIIIKFSLRKFTKDKGN